MGRVIDLTQEIHSGMQLFPLHSPTQVLPWSPRERYGWTSNALFINEHAGTHLDAPHHFVDGGETVDQIDLSRLTGPAVALDMSAHHPKGLISAADLERATAKLPLQEGDAVLLWTGVDRFLGQREFLTTYAGLAEDGAQLLVERGVRLVGTDAPGIDMVEALPCPAHHVLLPAGVLIVENLANLAELLQVVGGQRRCTLHTFPLKIRGGTGSPIRAVAVVD